MDKKVALILGGLGGIGRAAAEILKNQGQKVYLGYRQKAGEDLADFSPIKFDVTNLSETSLAVDKIIDLEKKIDVVVYSVSIPLSHKRIFDLNWLDFQNHLEAQVKGFLNVVLALKDSIKNGQKIKFIVVLSEVCCGKPPKMLADYVTAKYGLMGLVRALASDLDKSNCTFNLVSPGLVQTGLISDFPAKLIELAAQNNPLGRIAQPKDVAEVIGFLAGAGADYVNGQNIAVNGGNIF